MTPRPETRDARLLALLPLAAAAFGLRAFADVLSCVVRRWAL